MDAVEQRRCCTAVRHLQTIGDRMSLRDRLGMNVAYQGSGEEGKTGSDSWLPAHIVHDHMS